MRIFLEPNESLLFRTGRPFDAGEADYAETLFPPTPETIQGAVRTLIATAQDTHATLSQLFRPGSPLVSLVGDRESYGRFRVTNIALARRLQNSMDIEPLYPVPAHLMKDEQGFFCLKPVERKEIRSNMPAGMRYLMPPNGRPKGKIQPVDGWLTETDLRNVLSVEADPTGLQIIRGTDVFLHEPRIGIAMDNATKSSREGMFYSVQMLRMQHDLRIQQDQRFTYGFLVDVRLADEISPDNLLPDNQTRMALKLHTRDQGWVVLGGEQRAASYRIVGESAPLPHQQMHVGHSTLLYLTTPAAFKKGWRPEAWPDGHAPIAVAVSRYQSIGGWKLNPGQSGGGENKCMRRCVPAGSVYFFDSVASLPSTFTDYGREIGYGISITGEW